MLCSVCREDKTSDHFSLVDYLNSRVNGSMSMCVDCIKLGPQERTRTRDAITATLLPLLRSAKMSMQKPVTRKKEKKPKKAKHQAQKPIKSPKIGDTCGWNSLSAEKRRAVLLAKRPPTELLFEAELIKRKIKFEAQKIVGGFWIDFHILPEKLGVELDGEYHFTPEQQIKDAKRTVFLESKGWTILRYKNEDVKKNISGVFYDIAMERDRR